MGDNEGLRSHLTVQSLVLVVMLDACLSRPLGIFQWGLAIKSRDRSEQNSGIGHDWGEI